jgi:hypothetical protein
LWVIKWKIYNQYEMTSEEAYSLYDVIPEFVETESTLKVHLGNYPKTHLNSNHLIYTEYKLLLLVTCEGALPWNSIV